MSEIALSRESTSTDLLVSRGFLTEYMPSANGEYVKIYLYLLHYIQSGASLSMSEMADTFDETEKDILRALRYWHKKGVIELTFEGKTVTGIKLLAPWEKNDGAAVTAEAAEASIPSAVETGAVDTKYEPAQTRKAAKPAPATDGEDSETTDLPRYTVTSEMMTKAGRSKKFNELLNLTQIYFKTPLNDMDYERLVGVYFQMGQNSDACEVLVEYCAEKKGPMSRMTRLERLACACTEEGLSDTKSIKMYLARDDHYELVKEALAVPTKYLASSQKELVQDWFEKMGFSEDMVKEACARTADKAEANRFKFANAILSSWYEKKIHTLKQVREDDEAHKKRVESAAPKKTSSSRTRSTTNKFNDFEQREIDFNEMEDILFNYTD